MHVGDSDWEQLRPATAADVTTACEIFTRFAEEPVEGVDPEGGDVSASYGVYDWRQGRGEQFQLGIARGYVFLDEDGEYSHSAMLQARVPVNVSGRSRPWRDPCVRQASPCRSSSRGP
jgi:hypothetical protein